MLFFNLIPLYYILITGRSYIYRRTIVVFFDILKSSRVLYMASRKSTVIKYSRIYIYNSFFVIYYLKFFNHLHQLFALSSETIYYLFLRYSNSNLSN